MIVLANTLMNDDIMEEYGLILDSTQKGGYKNGTERVFTNLTAYLNGLESSKKHSCIAGITLTGTGLKAWLTNIKNWLQTKPNAERWIQLQDANYSELLHILVHPLL